jgi:serine phosphatase RsbU (regulator of sigma subunit)
MNREQQRNKAVQSLAENVVKGDKDVKENADKLASFQKQHNVVVLGQNQNDTTEMLKQYKVERQQLAIEITRFELSAKDVEGYMATTSSGATRAEQEYLKTRTELDVCQVDLEILRESHKTDSPVIQEAQARMARLQKLLAVYARQITDTMQTRRDQTDRRMTLLDQKIAELTKGAIEMGGVLSEHARLQKNVEGAEAVRKEVFDLMHKFTVAEETSGDYVTVMERATPAVEQAQTWWGGASTTPAQK